VHSHNFDVGEKAALNKNAKHFGTLLFFLLWEFKNISCWRSRARKAARNKCILPQSWVVSAAGHVRLEGLQSIHTLLLPRVNTDHNLQAAQHRVQQPH
jgi:hypothetical protein